MDCTGSSTLVTPRPAAVPGISWVRPRAPAPEPALGLNPDSCLIRPASNAGSTPLALAAWVISFAYGPLDGSALVLVLGAVVPLASEAKSVLVLAAGGVVAVAVALASALENDVGEALAGSAVGTTPEPNIDWIWAMRLITASMLM